jgi:hypothetical protein
MGQLGEGEGLGALPEPPRAQDNLSTPPMFLAFSRTKPKNNLWVLTKIELTG